MFAVETGVFDAGHEFRAMFGEMVIEAGVTRLVNITATQIGLALIARCALRPLSSLLPASW